MKSSGKPNRLKFLILFACTAMLTVSLPQTTFASAPTCETTIEGSRAPSTLSLLGVPNDPNRVQLSDYGTTRDKTELERGFTNLYSRTALRRTLLTTDGALRMLGHLVRLGLVEPSAKDPIYASYLLVAENKEISLSNSNPHANRAVNTYLANMRFAKIAQATGRQPVLSPLSQAERDRTLYFMFLSVFKPINDQDIESRDAVNAALTEIGRANDRGMGLDQAIDLGMNSLRAYGTYIPSELEIPSFVETVVGEIPFGGFAIEGIRQAIYFMKGGGQREQKREVHEIGQEPMQRTLVEDSVYLIFQNRDPRALESKAKAFLSKYSTLSTSEIFSVEFAKDAIEAYPEIALTSRAKKKLGKTRSSKMITQGVFGTQPYDTYVRLTRMALVIQLLTSSGAINQLPHLPRGETNRMRQELFQDLRLAKNGTINFEELDQFFVFMSLDTISDAIDPFIQSLDLEHSLSQRFGTLDKEKRTLEILRRYRLSSYSFARLSPEKQKKLFEALELTRQYSVLQISRGELGSATLGDLSSVSWNTLALTSMNGLLTFAAEGTAEELATARLITLNRDAYNNSDTNTYLLFHSAAASDTRDKPNNISTIENFKEEQRSQLKNKGLRNTDSAPQELVRMALLFDTKYNSQLRALNKAFNEMPNRSREDIAAVMENTSIRWFHLSKTLKRLASQALQKVSKDNPRLLGEEKMQLTYAIALTEFAKICRQVINNVSISTGLEKSSAVAISLAPYYQLVGARGIESMINSQPALSEVEGGSLVITVP